jgi:lipid-A-disaccharide synthase
VPDTRAVTLAMVAGEASGDLLGAHLIKALKAHLPHARFVGIGGPRMQAEGMQVLHPQEKLAVHGYVEALRHYPEIAGIRRQLIQRWRTDKPDLFIGIDAPDFNLHLERKLKQRGVPAIHYVSPSIWAWRGERIHKIRQSVNHILTLFPFEKPLYDKVGVPATYVGHPLADLLPEAPDRAAMREQLKLPQDATVVALLPGSRQSELQAMSDLFIRSAERLLLHDPDVRFLVPLVSRETRLLFEETLYRLNAAHLPLTILFGHAHDAMIASDAVLVASGTATLEAALLKRPMVITYRVPSLSWNILRHMNYQPYYGLPNILAGRFVVPEFIQDDATPENLAQALLNQLRDKTVRARLEHLFTHLHHQLRQNTAERAAEVVLSHL